MLKKQIRKKLLEEKRKKELIISQSILIENRLSMIVESEEKLLSLSKEKQRKVFFQIVNEINTLEENGLLNEEFGGILQKLFGNAFSSIAQSFVEPMIGSILGAIGLKGYFRDFVTSFIVSDPQRLVKAFKSCEELTKLISEAITEGLFMSLQRQKGLESKGYSMLRNLLGGTIKDTEFIQKIEGNISDTVCSLFDKFSSNAGNVLTKVGPNVVGDVKPQT